MNIHKYLKHSALARRSIIHFLLLSLYVHSARTQLLSPERANDFIHALVTNSDSLTMFIYPEELKTSNRLNIRYDHVPFKFMIGYNIDDAIKEEIRNGTLHYKVTTDDLGNGFSKLILSIDERVYSHEFYFENSFMVSPIFYYTRDWNKWRSEHFTVLTKDSADFNEYSLQCLESFLDSAAHTLQFTQQEMVQLRQAGIIIALCSNQKEIEALTGFQTLGMYVLAYDYVATTYNCHYHELLHLLMNFKLRHLPLYTHPFFQEGFAVAFGGRGGKDPGTILDAGYYIAQSGFLDYHEILSKEQFLQNDASMTYPLSGLYNYFLLNELGILHYLELYRKYSGDEHATNYKMIDSTDLPPDSRWQEFLQHYHQYETIDFNKPMNIQPPVLKNSKAEIAEDKNRYFIQMKDTLLLSTSAPLTNYRSKIFQETCPQRTYRGEKYLLLANEQEIKVYNLYTNILIAHYVVSFSIPQKKIPINNGLFEFNMRKSLFDEPSKELHIND